MDVAEEILVTTETLKELWRAGGGGRVVRVETRESRPAVLTAEVASRAERVAEAGARPPANHRLDRRRVPSLGMLAR